MKKLKNTKETYMLVALAYALAFLLLSGKMHLVLSPRFVPFDYFALVFISLLAAYKIYYMKDNISVDKIAVIVFVFFMLIALFVPPVKTIDTEVFGDFSADVSNTSFLYDVAEGKIEIEPTGKTMEFTEENWNAQHIELYSNLNDHLGDRIMVSGFVYKADTLPDNQFFIGRYLMWCCVADAIPRLIIVESNYTEYISDEWWLYIEGNISVTLNNQTGDVMPLIFSDTIELIEEGNYYVYTKMWN